LFPQNLAVIKALLLDLGAIIDCRSNRKQGNWSEGVKWIVQGLRAGWTTPACVTAGRGGAGRGDVSGPTRAATAEAAGHSQTLPN